MYNRELKELFIPFYTKQRLNVKEQAMQSLFEKVQTFEEAAQKDCSEFTEVEILSMYKEFESISPVSLLQQNTILSAYTLFVIHQTGRHMQNAYEPLTVGDLKQCVSATELITRRQLSDLEDQLLNDVDKAILECLWEGFSGKVKLCDLVSLEDSMINHKTKEIQINGVTRQLTDRLYHLLNRAFKENLYQCFPNANNGEIMVIELADDPGKLYKLRWNADKGKQSARTRYEWVFRKIESIREFYGIPHFTIKNLQDSGFVYYLKIGMLENGVTSLYAFLNTPAGEQIARKYGYTSKSYASNCLDRFAKYFK